MDATTDGCNAINSLLLQQEAQRAPKVVASKGGDPSASAAAPAAPGACVHMHTHRHTHMGICLGVYWACMRM